MTSPAMRASARAIAGASRSGVTEGIPAGEASWASGQWVVGRRQCTTHYPLPTSLSELHPHAARDRPRLPRHDEPAGPKLGILVIEQVADAELHLRAPDPHRPREVHQSVRREGDAVSIERRVRPYHVAAQVELPASRRRSQGERRGADVLRRVEDPRAGEGIAVRGDEPAVLRVEKRPFPGESCRLVEPDLEPELDALTAAGTSAGGRRGDWIEGLLVAHVHPERGGARGHRAAIQLEPRFVRPGGDEREPGVADDAVALAESATDVGVEIHSPPRVNEESGLRGSHRPGIGGQLAAGRRHARLARVDPASEAHAEVPPQLLRRLEEERAGGLCRADHVLSRVPAPRGGEPVLAVGVIPASLGADGDLGAAAGPGERAGAPQPVAPILLLDLAAGALGRSPFGRRREEELPAALGGVERAPPEHRGAGDDAKAHPLLGPALEPAVGGIGDPPEIAGGELPGGEKPRRVSDRGVQLDASVERCPGGGIAHGADMRLAELVAAVGPPAVLAYGAKARDTPGALPVPPREPRPFHAAERAGREVGGRPAHPDRK